MATHKHIKANTFLSLLSICLLLGSTMTLSCVDINGKEKKWYAALRKYKTKQPRQYLFFSNTAKKFKEFNEKEIFGTLFDQVDLSNHSTLIWNDGNPYNPKTYSGYAHDKGLIVFDLINQEGFYLAHSIPKWPKINENKLDYSSEGASVFGQSMFCYSIKSTYELSSLFQSVTATKPVIYHDTLSKIFPPGNQQGRKLITLQKQSFTFISKPYSIKDRHYLGDLFNEYWVKRGFTSGFYVRTWGRPWMESQCEGDKITDQVLDMKYGKDEKVMDKYKDHSKWAISIDPKEKLVCIGGINFQSSQISRGGTYTCVQNSYLYKEFAKTIVSTKCGSSDNSLDFPKF